MYRGYTGLDEQGLILLSVIRTFACENQKKYIYRYIIYIIVVKF